MDLRLTTLPGDVTYGGIPAKQFERYMGDTIYTAEEDVHFPTLTVRQTLTAALTTLLKPHPSLSDPLLADLYALARTHDLRAQGVLQGRAIARRALQERDKRIEVLEREVRELREGRD